MPIASTLNRLDRAQALRLWTEGNTWFSNEQGRKGRIAVGQLADLAVLSDDFFRVPEDEIAHLSAVLTLLGGQVVHGTADFADLAPPMPPVLPDWSPVRRFGGYQQRRLGQPGAAKMAAMCACASGCAVHGHDHAAASRRGAPARDAAGFWDAFGCGCWAA